MAVYNTNNCMIIKALKECDKRSIEVNTIERVSHEGTSDCYNIDEFKAYTKFGGIVKLKVTFREDNYPFWGTTYKCKFEWVKEETK